MLRITGVFWNTKGHSIAAVGFDADRGEWRINIYEDHGFATEDEAIEFWNANFDRETGLRLSNPDEGKKGEPGKNDPRRVRNG